MRIYRLRAAVMVALLGFGSLVFASCPLSGLADDCIGVNTISESEYDDLNGIDQLGYEENNCGRYERRSDLWGDLFG